MLNFLDFIRTKWAEYSQSSGQKGTTIDELAVKPTGLIISDFYNTLVDQRKVNDISRWKEMTDEELDFFGAKFFIPRVQGSTAYGSIRIYFDSRKDFEVSDTTRFISNTNRRYKAAMPGMYSQNNLAVSNDRYARFYIDVPIVAESHGDEFNTDAGTISQINGITFTYKAVTNPESVSNGTRYETNAEYYRRLIYSINDRSLTNKASVYSMLPVLFPSIGAMYIAGSGDKYMQRDLITASDLSISQQKADFLGKRSGDSFVPHIAFYGQFPGEAGSRMAELWGPISKYSNYQYPLTIEPSDLNNEDPAYYGFPIDQEASDEMYRGLFFDDFRSFMSVSSSDLFNIYDEEVGFTDILIPNSDWIYGSVGRGDGDFGELNETLQAIDVLKFNNNLISMSGGALSYSISTGKDIKKRVGVKVTGTFKWPAIDDSEDLALNSNLQIMVGGANSSTVDGYTGVGFGVRVTGEYDADDLNNKNAVLYFAHGEQYGTAQVFANDSDFVDAGGHIGITDIGALAEKLWRIEPGMEYEFEFVFYDDLRLSLYINKLDNRLVVDSSENENTVHFDLPSTPLRLFQQELNKKDSTHYGTIMKLTLDTHYLSGQKYWEVSDLRAFDISTHRSMALFAIDVNDISAPLSIYLRGKGYSAINDKAGDGHIAYIWDKEKSSIASVSGELTEGAWTLLSGISNQNGSIDSVATLLQQDIDNIDRYRVDNRFGKNIFLLIVTSGTSKANIKYSGISAEDVLAYLRIDYLKVESRASTQYHANNKVDVYVSTIKNSENYETRSVIVTKQSNQSYFELSSDTGFKMPIAEIISIATGVSNDQTNILNQSDYYIVRDDEFNINSSHELVKIITARDDINTITVNYKSFPDIQIIQNICFRLI